MTKRLYHTFEPEALQREGLPEKPAIWEDGRRGESRAGFFERWQFDAAFSDGSLALITFFTRPMLDRSTQLRPGVSITIVPPDGKPLVQAISLPPEDFSAGKERCYVRAGESWVRGDPQWRYELHVKAGGLAAHLNFTGIVPAWRPGAGKFYARNTGAGQDGYFGWLVGVPYGTVEGFLTYRGKIHLVQGSCYHDHRWSNLALNEVFDRWYLGRARIGEISLIFLELTGSAAYGGQKIPSLLVAKDGQQILDDCANFSLAEQDFLPDPRGRSYPAGLDGCWERAEQSLRFTLRDPKMIDSFSLVDFLPTWQRLVGSVLTNPYHFTFSAGIELQAALGGIQTRGEGQALYEFVLF